MSTLNPKLSEPADRKRGKGRGGNFFAVDLGTWEELWALDTTNRMNLVLMYLVISAGTGSDHQLSKWSTKACERYTGLGKPRAKVAVDELVSQSGPPKRFLNISFRGYHLTPILYSCR